MNFVLNICNVCYYNIKAAYVKYKSSIRVRAGNCDKSNLVGEVCAAIKLKLPETCSCLDN